MSALLQRVSSGKVTVDDQTIAQIGRGLVILLGIGQEDGEEQAVYLAEKIANLRIFEDEGGQDQSVDFGCRGRSHRGFTVHAVC